MRAPCSEAYWVPSTGRESLGYCVEHPELAAWPCPWGTPGRDALQATVDVLRAALNVALNSDDPEALEGARLALAEVRREDLTLLHERDALAAKVAAVEALVDRMAKIHNRLHGDVEINHHEHLRSARDHVRTLHDDLRAALEADQ